MKLIKYIVIAAFGAAMFIGCSDPYPHEKFGNDKAFVAFGKNSDRNYTYTKAENAADPEIKIPIYLASEKDENRLSATVTIGAVAEETTAVSGRHYTIDATTFSFTKDHWIDTVRIRVIDNNDYEGDKVLVVKIQDIVSDSKIQTLAEDFITITIKDDEKP